MKSEQPGPESDNHPAAEPGAHVGRSGSEEEGSRVPERQSILTFKEWQLQNFSRIWTATPEEIQRLNEQGEQHRRQIEEDYQRAVAEQTSIKQTPEDASQ
jgi:hypothetical protein